MNFENGQFLGDNSSQVVFTPELEALISSAEKIDYSVKRVSLNQLYNLKLISFGVNDGNIHYTENNKLNFFRLDHKGFFDPGQSILNDPITTIGEVEYKQYDPVSKAVFTTKERLKFNFSYVSIGPKEKVFLKNLSNEEQFKKIMENPTEYIKMVADTMNYNWKTASQNRIGFNTSIYPGPLYHWTSYDGYSEANRVYTSTFGTIDEKMQASINAGKNVTFGLYDNGGRNMVFFLLQYPEYADPQLFFNALDTEDDIITYLKILKCYKCAGIDTAPDKYIKMFKEVVAARSLVKAYEMGTVTYMTFDLSYLKDYYNTLFTKTLRAVEAEIESSEIVNAQSLDPKLPSLRYHISFSSAEKQRLLKIYHEAASVIANNLVELEAQYAVLESTNEAIRLDETQRNPLLNPFIVYNPQESEKRGVATYTDIARNKNLNYSQLERNIEYARGPSISAFEKAPEIRARHLRNIPTEQGYVSMQDLIDTGIVKENKNTFLWIAGGIAAAALASQVL